MTEADNEISAPKPARPGMQARRRARRLALQAVYQWQVNPAPVEQVEAEYRADNDMRKIDGVYFHELIEGTVRQCSELDELIAPLLDREASRLTPIERALLRLACWELRERMDVPARVVINEAVELCKQFGATDGHRFVNGVLDRLATQLRDVEMGAPRRV